jgi:hypothetical protein
MSETLEDLEQRLGDGTVTKIAELLGLVPPKLLRMPEVGDRDFIVLFLLEANENLLREREHLRQVVLALAETTGFPPSTRTADRPSRGASSCRRFLLGAGSARRGIQEEQLHISGA